MSADAATPAPQEIDSLIERCLKGDQTAWETIVRLYWRKVFNIAYKFVGRHDEAEDLTQDVFLKLFKSIKTFDRRANFSTWLISVSRNLCIDHYRSVRREHDAVTHDIDVVTLAQPSTIDSPHAMLERRDRVALLRAALDRLAPSLRMAVMLRDIQELSYQEIAGASRRARGHREVTYQPRPDGTCTANRTSSRTSGRQTRHKTGASR